MSSKITETIITTKCIVETADNKEYDIDLEQYSKYSKYFKKMYEDCKNVGIKYIKIILDDIKEKEFDELQYYVEYIYNEVIKGFNYNDDDAKLANKLEITIMQHYIEYQELAEKHFYHITDALDKHINYALKKGKIQPQDLQAAQLVVNLQCNDRILFREWIHDFIYIHGGKYSKSPETFIAFVGDKVLRIFKKLCKYIADTEFEKRITVEELCCLFKGKIIPTLNKFANNADYETLKHQEYVCDHLNVIRAVLGCENGYCLDSSTSKMTISLNKAAILTIAHVVIRNDK